MVAVVLVLGLGPGPPVQHSVCYFHTELAPPGLSARSCCPAGWAMVGMAVPGGVEHDTAHDADEYQADAS